MSVPEIIFDGPADAALTIALAHGAGAAMDSPFMDYFAQGLADKGRGEVKSYHLSPAIYVHWLADGDHGFKPRKASGRTEQQNWDEAIAAIGDFLS